MPSLIRWFAVVTLALLSSAAASAAPSLSERFQPRGYRQAGGREVPVTARDDMLAIRGRLEADAAARLVEDVAAKLVPDGLEPRPALARLLRDHGSGEHLLLVEFSGQVERAVLVELAEELDARGVRTYPVLARMTGRAFADEHLIVTAEPGHLDAVLADLLPKIDGTLVRRSYVANTALVAVGAPFGFDAVEASSSLAGIPGLIAAEPNLYRELRASSTTPNDPLFASQWHLSRQGDSVPGLGQIHADVAWDVTLGDPSVVVAVFDTGIDVDHPDLAPNMVPGFDAAGGIADTDPRPGCTGSFDGRGEVDDCPGERPYRESHGTSVAGTIAAVGDNGIGVSGVCPRCSLLPVRLITEGTQDSLTIAETFEKAVDLGADVINNSWGPGFSVFFPLSEAERAAFAHARNQGRLGRGTVILFAAGNETSDVSSDAYASDPYVISVAASTNLDDWALYSNYGAQIDIAAPSQGLPFDQDNIRDDDYGIVTTDVSGDDGYDAADYNPGFSGTSAASPVAAGVVGLVLAVNPLLTAEQVRLVLTSTAEKIVADKMPWPDLIGEDIEAVFAYDETGHSIGFGYGRVDAAAAVAAAAGFGLLGGFCNAPCDFCSADGRCLTPCESQADCLDGSVCDAQLGACALPRHTPGAFLEPCSASCAFCTPTLDTEFATVSICTVECASDDECPDGFDCRLTDVGGPSICGVGDKSAGDPVGFFNCFSPQIGTSIVVNADGDHRLCSDACFEDGPGACPYGFTCGLADCECTAEGNGGCFEFTCRADDDPDFDQNDFFFPVCLPNPGFSDACAADVDCQKGDTCFEGRCRLDDRAGCDICKTCTADEECSGRGICIGLRDDGVGQCVWSCENAAPCPGDSVCRSIPSNFGPERQVCLSPEGGVTEADRCDPDWTCSVPECRDDIPCGPGGTCEDGVCVALPPQDDKEDEAGDGCGCAGASPPDAFGLAIGLVLLRRRRAARSPQT